MHQKSHPTAALPSNPTLSSCPSPKRGFDYMWWVLALQSIIYWPPTPYYPFNNVPIVIPPTNIQMWSFKLCHYKISEVGTKESVH